MNRGWEIVNVFLTHNSPDDVYQAWCRIRAEQGESPVTDTQHTQPAKCPSCFGAGREYNGPYGYTDRPCVECGGTGIQQASA